MGHKEKVMEVMQVLKKANDVIAGDVVNIRYNIGWSRGHSERMQARKVLDRLVAERKIIKKDGYYHTPDVKDGYGEHAQLLTCAIAEILKLGNNKPIIFREKLLSVGLRPDALVLLKRNNQGLCFALEILNNETRPYLQQKINTWKNWRQGTAELSRLFNVKIPHFDVVVHPEKPLTGDVVAFNDLIKEVKK